MNAESGWSEPVDRLISWRARRRLRRHAALLAASGLFDPVWYTEQYPEAAAFDGDPALHYLVSGAREGLDPGPNFSGEAYHAANPDVAAAGVNPLVHYLARGRAEQRPLSASVSAEDAPTEAFVGHPPPTSLRRRARTALRPWLRPRRVMQPSLPDGFGDTALLHPLDGHPPTGWTIVQVPPDPDGAPASLRFALRVLRGGEMHEIALPATSGSALVRLPESPARLGLGCGIRSGLKLGDAGLPERVVLREIGRPEAMLRLMLAHGWGVRRLWQALRDPHARLGPALRDLAVQHTPAEMTGYQHWIDLHDTPTRTEVAAMRSRARLMQDPPRFSVIVPAYNTRARPLREMIGSVRAQLYPHWELCIADDASTAPHVRAILESAAAEDARMRLDFRQRNGNISAASNSALELATGEFAALLDHDDVLAPHALLVMAEAIAANPGVDLLYSDEDKLDAQGRRYDPYFKPDYSPELLQGQNFISHLGVYRLAALRAAGGFREGFEGSQDYDLALRVAARTGRPIVHVPHVLYHWRLYPGAGTFSSTQMSRATIAARCAIQQQAAFLGESVEVVTSVADYHRVMRRPPDPWPLVTAIVPTRDHLEVLQDCIDGLLDATDYPALEVIVADNGSVEPATHAYFARLAQRGVRVLAHPGPFNYSAINNAAAAQARGEVLLLLNSDISMPEPGWLRELVTHAVRPDVGAVGARLLYPDGTLQHAGVVLGLGGAAGHGHVGAERGDPGYFGQLMMTREISAVTAACLATRRVVFERIGGLDAVNLPVAFNDVDFCLRLREAGLRIIWTPHAELVHHESKSRGSDFTPERVEKFHAEVAYMLRRWGPELLSDPFFNPNLSLSHARPTPAFPPRVPRPWATDIASARHLVQPILQPEAAL